MNEWVVLFFVVVVPYVFVGGVVPILYSTGCVLLFFFIKKTLHWLSFHLETWMVFFFVVVPILAFVLFSCENLWWVSFLFIFWASLSFMFFIYLIYIFSGFNCIKPFAYVNIINFLQANRRTNSEVKDSPWWDVYL